MALGKLAFQAADAFAPMTKKTSSTAPNLNGSAPNLASTPEETETPLDHPDNDIETITAEMERQKRPWFTLENETTVDESDPGGGEGDNGSNESKDIATTATSLSTPEIPNLSSESPTENVDVPSIVLEDSESHKHVVDVIDANANKDLANQNTISPDSVNVQIANGSGPPKTTDLDPYCNEESKTSISPPNSVAPQQQQQQQGEGEKEEDLNNSQIEHNDSNVLNVSRL